MVQELHDAGIKILITVDNGVSARKALELARDLAMEVIVTDHHTIPENRPPMAALIHPATTPEASPYRGLAGVGLAYVLALAVAEDLQRPEAIRSARDLFCIGTVADMAPLQGANRRWLHEGLRHLHRTDCAGLKALQRLAGLDDRPLRSDDIGFQIAPRINAVGRLGEPGLVVDLLTSVDADVAMGLARRCDDYNRQRRDLCDAIEAEAVALIEADNGGLPPFVLLAQSHWHHGVIGIVAARLVERYNRPAALLAGEGNGMLRASVRAPKGFAVDTALQSCHSLLDRYGGHPAAGGFTVAACHVSALHEQLNDLAQVWLSGAGEGLPVQPEALLRLEQINWELWNELQKLEPFGVGNETPLFWARDCAVVQSRVLNGGHLSLTLSQDDVQRRAIAWRWRGQEPCPERCDVAFNIGINRWQGETRLQLVLKALRQHTERIDLVRGNHRYNARLVSDAGLIVRNDEGQEISAEIKPGSTLISSNPLASHPMVHQLLEEASLGLGLRP
jgi:single-stranded-DNA-specific exonuclease